MQDCHGHNCPLGVAHPPAGQDPAISAYPLGCGLCRAERMAAKKVDGVFMQEVKLTQNFNWTYKETK